MNRPFYAVGVLLAFLALAMLAVGLSSRPTLQPAGAHGASGPARRAASPTAYLLAVPDNDQAVAHIDDVETAEEAAHRLPCEQPCYAYGCGLDRNTGLVYTILTASGRQQNLRAAQIAVAADPNSFQATSAIDCRAHYDRLYDGAVYGGRFESPRSGPWAPASVLRTPSMALPAEIEGEDATLRLFFSLAGRHPNRPVLLNLRPSRQWRLALTQVGRGLANRVWLVAERLGLADRWQRVAAVIGPRPAPPEPSWADYEAWIASLQPRVAERDTPGAGLGNWRDEPWRQVLQIAVSWLNHAAKTLDSVAERLSGAGNWAADDRIGIRAPGDASR